MSTLSGTTATPRPHHATEPAVAPVTAELPVVTERASAAAPARAGRRRARTARRWVADIIWTVLALLGLGGLTLFAGVASGALSTMVVISGSMTPTYHVGDGLISHRVSADTVEVGDIVSVYTPDGVLVTHRIVGIEEGPSSARTLTLRGDANPGNDPFQYVVTDVLVPRIVVPHAGTIVDLARTPAVAIPVVVGVGGLLGYALWPDDRKRDRRADGPSGSAD